MRVTTLAGLCLALAASTCGSAGAAVISAQVVTGSTLPFTVEALGSSATAGVIAASTITTPDEQISFSGGATEAGLFSGDLAGQRRSPFDGTDLAPEDFLAVEPGGSITITFASAQTEFDMLWGSLDTYNHLTIGGVSISGQDIATAAGGAAFGTANLAVEISSLPAFTSVTLTSDVPAFEFVPGLAVPEPASIALFGLGLLGLGLAATRRGELAPARRV